jgi:spore maturation protein CgeB
VSELLSRGHQVRVYEPDQSWSRCNLVAQQGPGADAEVFDHYPQLQSVSRRYDPASLDLDQALDHADLVLVHEWSDPELVATIGAHRRQSDYRLFFHDTHHRSVSDPKAMAAYDLRDYDGVLAFGEVISELYRRNGWARAVWTWHEAADTRLFFPREAAQHADLVWIGNWGDGERERELRSFLFNPIRRLGLGASLYGVRYPQAALSAAAHAGAIYHGWLPNYQVPETFARHRVTVHVPRGPYARQLPGIPTIRPFEALACGIPLICSPWEDSEGLFRPGKDFLTARNEDEMVRHLKSVLHDPELARDLASNGLERVRARHTCAHRVDELLSIHASLEPIRRPQRHPPPTFSKETA